MLAVLEPSGHCIGRLVNGNVRATRLKARERLLFHDGGASTFDQMRQSLSRALTTQIPLVLGLGDVSSRKIEVAESRAVNLMQSCAN